jgi:hypothetical protein
MSYSTYLECAHGEQRDLDQGEEVESKTIESHVSTYTDYSYSSRCAELDSRREIS